MLSFSYMKHLPSFFHRGTKTPLVYLPGLGCSREDFSPALKDQHLRKHAILTLDYPGCNGSPYPKQRHLDIDGLANLIISLTKQKTKQPVILVAHSMGSMVALAIAKKYPRNILGIIHVEGTLDLPREDRTSLANLTRRILPLKIQTFHRSQNIGRRTYAEQLTLTDPCAYFDYKRSMLQETKGGKLVRQYQKLNIPQVYLYGSRMLKLHPYVHEIKKASLSVIKLARCGHFPMHEQPKSYTQALRQAIELLIKASRPPFLIQKRRA